MAISMYSEMFARSRGQGLLFVNLVRRAGAWLFCLICPCL
jgi:hypothetical protein